MGGYARRIPPRGSTPPPPPPPPAGRPTLVDELRRERDEARAALADLTETIDAYRGALSPRYHETAGDAVLRVAAERDALRAALADLVELHDGPRGATYAARKPAAWAAARAALGLLSPGGA